MCQPHGTVTAENDELAAPRNGKSGVDVAESEQPDFEVGADSSGINRRSFTKLHLRADAEGNAVRFCLKSAPKTQFTHPLVCCTCSRQCPR